MNLVFVSLVHIDIDELKSNKQVQFREAKYLLGQLKIFLKN